MTGDDIVNDPTTFTIFATWVSDNALSYNNNNSHSHNDNNKTTTAIKPPTLRTRFRRTITRSVNKLERTYIYGWTPALHTIILAIEMAVISQVVRRYDHYFETKPILTMMVTNSILGGIADTVAQSVTAIRRRSAARNPKTSDTLLKAIELSEKLPHYGHELIPTDTRNPTLPSTFDFSRLTRFMSYGFLIAPIQFRWLQFLQRTFPLTATSAAGPALKRVAVDQGVFAPVGLLAFFSYMTFAEGGGIKDLRGRLEKLYIPTIKANYLLWPAVQWLNFRVVPLQFQLPFVSTVGIVWGTYLSITNSSIEG